MKIKTITCHDVYNFGASLQALAFQTYLKSVGYDVEIIDYIPSYKNIYPIFKIANKGLWGKLNSYMPIFKPIWGILQNRNNLKQIPKMLVYKKFKKEYLCCTKKKYRSFKELVYDKPVADLFIAGSDQIWNPEFQNGLDPSYYCMFEEKKEKCISYAASFGVSEIQEVHKEFITQAIKHFKAISIREISGVRLAKELGVDAVNVLDPVFLLDKYSWMELAKCNNKERYLIVYDFAVDDCLIKAVAIKIAQDRHLKIYTLNKKQPYADRYLNACSPIEFIQLIAGADMIIGNSFHATAFSIILEKDFYTLPLKEYHNNSRMKDLLDLFRLSDRFITDISEVNSYKHIDYSSRKQLIELEIEKSKKWLITQISSKQ